LALVVGLLVGGITGYLITRQEINRLQNQVSDLQDQISLLRENIPLENITYIVGDNTSLSNLYENVNDSVVVIEGVIPQNVFVQGSGFVYDINGRRIIVTNFHVVNGATNITVTFIDGNSYPATVLGSDAYADLAALSTEAPDSETQTVRPSGGDWQSVWPSWIHDRGHCKSSRANIK